MYEEFFEMEKTPFTRGIPVDDLYMDQDTEEVHNRLLYAASRQLFALVIGDPGTGKTTSLRRLKSVLDGQDYSVLYLSESKLTPRHFYNGLVTTNSDYSGCRDMNQSVISRMDLIYDMEAPDLNTMVKRVMNVTGFTDEQEATKMAIVVRDVAERCRQTMITDGSCGMREFKSWVLSTMVTHDPYESALSTIISSASADPDNRAELISACLEPQYTRTI